MNILLRSSWQTVNIGDISHTPSLLSLLEAYLPDAKPTVWAEYNITDEVVAMLHRRFPNVPILKGTPRTNPALAAAIQSADFYLHGSGPFLVGAKELQEMLRLNPKPFGVFGITYRENELEKELLQKAEFVFFRDSASLARAKADGVAAGHMAFGPDAAFACDLVNEEAANTFLAENRLTAGEFVACIPRLRYTPFWEFRGGRDYDAVRDARNREMAESDHAHLIAAITAVARSTDKKILLCPEDMSQMKVGREEIYDKLPPDVRERVVLRKEYWLTDEAVSVFRKAICLFGNEMHSPIMCIGNGIPAIVCRWQEQTTKGLMWRDIGLDEWLFDADEGIDAALFTRTVLSIIEDRETARAKTAAAARYVRELHRAMIARIAAYQ